MSVASRTVPLEPFQRRFAEMEAASWRGTGRHPKDAANTIAMRLGWYHKGGRLDGSRVRRTLGLLPDTPQFKGGKLYPAKLRERAGHEMALRLCQAMEIDPVEVDL